jgi:hypothetical protein
MSWSSSSAIRTKAAFSELGPKDMAMELQLPQQRITRMCVGAAKKPHEKVARYVCGYLARKDSIEADTKHMIVAMNMHQGVRNGWLRAPIHAGVWSFNRVHVDFPVPIHPTYGL